MPKLELPKPMMITPEECPNPYYQAVRYDKDNGEIIVCGKCPYLKYNQMNERWTCTELPELIEFQKPKRFLMRGEEHRKFKHNVRYRVGF